MAQSQLDRLDQAFVGESEKVGAIFGGKARGARGDIQQGALGFNLLAVPERQRIQHEVQVGVLNIVHRNLRGRSDRHRVVVAQISEICSATYERLHVHGKGAALRRFQNFTQIGVGYGDDAPHNRLVARNRAAIFRLDLGPANIEMRFVVKRPREFSGILRERLRREEEGLGPLGNENSGGGPTTSANVM